MLGQEWKKRAACLGHQAEMDRGAGRPGSPARRRALALCAICPVRKQCLAAGMQGEWGIWGGTTMNQRTRAGSPSFYEHHMADKRVA